MPDAIQHLQAIRPGIAAIVEAEGSELVDLTFRREHAGWVLRVLIDQPGGVTLDRCVAMNRLLSAALESSAVWSQPYTLEVASPGLDRQLATCEDFRRVIGLAVRMVVADPAAVQPARTQVVEGTVAGVDTAAVRVADASGGTVTVPLSHIKKAKRMLPW